jgi:hypothetical protein
LTAASVPLAGQVGLFDRHGFAFPFGLVLAVCVLLPSDRARWIPRHGRRFPAVLAAALLCLGGVYLSRGPLRGINPGRLSGYDGYTPVLEAAKGRPGLLLIESGLWGMGRPQLRTRRPLLIDPTQLNMLTKIPGSGPRMADILLRVYGIDLLQTVYEGFPGWMNLNLKGWRKIRREFGVTDVLAQPVPNLKLPVVIESDRLTLYAKRARKRATFFWRSAVSNDWLSAAIAKSMVASTARSTCRFSTRRVISTAWRGSLAILCAAASADESTSPSGHT